MDWAQLGILRCKITESKWRELNFPAFTFLEFAGLVLTKFEFLSTFNSMILLASVRALVDSFCDREYLHSVPTRVRRESSDVLLPMLGRSWGIPGTIRRTHGRGTTDNSGASTNSCYDH